MSDAIIADAAGQYPIETMGRALGVSVSGYYAWRERQPSARQQADQMLLSQLRAAYAVSRGLYGSPRIHAQLRRQGIRWARKRVARLMHQAGLHSRQPTQPSGRAEPVAAGFQCERTQPEVGGGYSGHLDR
jgi:hypothetical protein